MPAHEPNLVQVRGQLEARPRRLVKRAGHALESERCRDGEKTVRLDCPRQQVRGLAKSAHAHTLAVTQPRAAIAPSRATAVGCAVKPSGTRVLSTARVVPE